MHISVKNAIDLDWSESAENVITSVRIQNSLFLSPMQGKYFVQTVSDTESSSLLDSVNRENKYKFESSISRGFG